LSKDEAMSADGSPIDLTAVAQRLVEESAFDAVSERGTEIEVWTISSAGRSVRASAPRLEVAEGMSLVTRLVLDGIPHRVELTIAHAEVQSERRAALELLVTGATSDRYERRGERFEIRISASLTAIVCDRLVPGEVLPAQILDLSTSGFRARVAETGLRPGDRLRIYARLMEGTIDCEARVMRCEPLPGGGVTAGCAFLQPTVETRTAIERSLERRSGARPE
jgi:hypothetical protein